MATETRELQVKLTGDTRSLENALNNVSGRSNDTGLSFAKMTGAVAAGQFIFSAASKGIEALGGFIGDTVKAAMDSENMVSQLNAVLKSTGGVAGVTADQAIKLSQAFQKTTAYSDEQVLSAQNLLLTYTAIGKNIFPDATQAALDMAVALNHGVTPTAEEAADNIKILGKALQDPDAGLGALKRVGVNTDELSKKFQGLTDKSEKQKLILAELNTEFGGSAAAARNTLGGSMQALNNQFNDAQEKIGFAFLPTLTKLATQMSNFVQSDKFQAWIQKLADWISEKLPPFMDKLVNEYIPAAKKAFDDWWPGIKAVGEGIGGLINWFRLVGVGIEKFGYDTANAVFAVRDGFNAVVNFFSTIGSKVTGAISGAGNWLYNVGKDIIQGLINGISSIGGKIGDTISGLAKGAVNTAKSILGIRSPSTVFAEVGTNIGLGLTKGVMSTSGMVQDAMSQLASPSVAISQASNVAPSQQTSQVINISITGDFRTPQDQQNLGDMLTQQLRMAARGI